MNIEVMYKSGYTLRIYQILENDLVTFLNYIPIEYYKGEKRKEIYSPKLSELLLRIGSQVDIFFRQWNLVHEVYKKNYHKNKNDYLFSWDNIPGIDDEKFIEYFINNFGIDWAKTAKIEKIDDNETIRVSNEKNYLSLKINDDKIRVNLKINDDRTDELIVKTENDERNIYKFDLDNLEMTHYKNIETYGKIILSDIKIRILLTKEIIKPFQLWTDKGYPLWWTSYNNVKHQGFTYKEEGNLKNVIESLSALFLLNCIHKDIKNKLIEYGYRDISPHEARHLLSNGVWTRPSSPYIISHLFEFDERSLSTKMTPLSNTISL